MRAWRHFFNSWRFLIIFCVFLYFIIYYSPLSSPLDAEDSLNNDEKSRAGRVQRKQKQKEEEKPSFEFKPVGKESFFVEELLTNYGISLKEKMTCKVDKNAPKKIIVSVNAGHGNENLGGCPDWHCDLTYDRSKLPQADAVLIANDDGTFQQRQDQYLIYFSQESPKNSGFMPRSLIMNMTLGFRHDSATSSPYGYTVKLAKKSRKTGRMVKKERIEGKTKGAAWFVSHCGTNSLREKLVSKLQKDFPVDIYGACGTLQCPKGGECENSLDKDYFFYVAFENSICKDYITEKLWSQGYQRDVVPLVLKRSLVEPFVPPHSFIAADDFSNTEDMAAYLKYLMKNLTAYEEYFNWRKDHKVVFLDGNHHDVLERPWGFCQICRLMWENPKPQYTIPDFNSYWTDSCESDGDLVQRILDGTGKKRPPSKTPTDRRPVVLHEPWNVNDGKGDDRNVNEQTV